MIPPPERDPLGIPGYRWERELHRTRSSVVHLATEVSLDRLDVIKVLLDDDSADARRRFKRELATTIGLGEHPNIVQVWKAGVTDDDKPYIAMRYYAMGSLEQRVQVDRLSVDQVRTVGLHIASALRRAHREKVSHRDVKPANVLVSEDGYLLADFGIARSSDAMNHTSTADHFTPWHASPEVLLSGETSDQDDLWSLCSTLWTLLTGRPPFAGGPDDSFVRFRSRVADGTLPPVHRTDADDLFAILRRGLDKAASARFPTAADLEAALAVTAPAPSPAPPVGPPGPLGATDAHGRHGRGAPSPRPSAAPAPSNGPVVLGGDGPAPLDGSTFAAGQGDRTPAPVAAPAEERRSKVPYVVAAAVAVVVIVAGTIFLTQRGGGDAEEETAATTTTLVSVTTAPPATEGTPTDVAVAEGPGGTSVTVSWTDTSEGRTVPVVQGQGTDGSRVVGDPDPGATSVTITDLDPVVGYCFIVQGVARTSDGRLITLSAAPACIRGAEPSATVAPGDGTEATTTAPAATTTAAP